MSLCPLCSTFFSNSPFAADVHGKCLLQTHTAHLPSFPSSYSSALLSKKYSLLGFACHQRLWGLASVSHVLSLRFPQQTKASKVSFLPALFIMMPFIVCPSQLILHPSHFHYKFKISASQNSIQTKDSPDMNAISNQLPGHSSLTIIFLLYSLTIEFKDYTADMLSEFMEVVMGKEKTPLS